jgi:hypothetical protein
MMADDVGGTTALLFLSTVSSENAALDGRTAYYRSCL